MRANIESVWNSERDGTPVQMGFAQRDYFSREDYGRPKGLEMFLPRWDSSTMTLTADSKGRIACRDLFPPHASFKALLEPDGRVTLIRLEAFQKP